MSLNGLALAMWEHLGYQGMETSTLSRVIHGERLFTAEQLHAFCHILEIPEIESWELWEALKYEVYKRFDIQGDHLNPNGDFLGKFNNEVLEIRRARKLGEPHLAQEWIKINIDQLNNLLSASHGNTHKEILKIYAKLLIEKMWLLADTASGSELADNTLTIAKELEKISVDLHESCFATKAKVLTANMYYLCGNFKKSVFNKKTDWNFENANYYKGLALRNNALSYAHLNLENEFKTTKKEIFENLTLLPLNISCVALEGIARGEACLKHFNDSFCTLHLCKKLQKHMEDTNGDYEKLRKIQIARTEIYLGNKSGLYTSKNYLDKLARETILLAEDRGYTRHAEKIKALTRSVSS